MHNQLRSKELTLVEYPKKKIVSSILILVSLVIIIYIDVGSCFNGYIKYSIISVCMMTIVILMMRCTIDSMNVDKHTLQFTRIGLVSCEDRQFRTNQIKSVRMVKNVRKYITTYSLQLQLISGVYIDTFRSYSKKKICEMYVIVCEYIHIKYNIHKLIVHIV